MRRPENYMKKRGGRLIKATRNNTNNTRITRTKITRKQKSEERQLYGYFKQQINEISSEKNLTWLKKRNLMRETECLKAAQNNAKRTKFNRKYNRLNKVANIGYLVIVTKRSII